MTSVSDLFALDGSLFDESVEFQGVKLSGVNTMLFKCRQKKNLTKFIRNVLAVAAMPPSKIHNDFRTN